MVVLKMFKCFKALFCRCFCCGPSAKRRILNTLLAQDSQKPYTLGYILFAGRFPVRTEISHGKKYAHHLNAATCRLNNAGAVGGLAVFKGLNAYTLLLGRRKGIFAKAFVKYNAAVFKGNHRTFSDGAACLFA